MLPFTPQDPAERALLKALAHTIEEGAGSSNASECPSKEELLSLAKGVPNGPRRRKVLLTHLADCNRCIQTLKRIRDERIRMQRFMVLASVLLVAVATWIWSQNHRRQPPDLVTTIDLRIAPYTRGDETAHPPQPAKISRPTAHLRIILPLGSEGSYEAVIASAESDQPTLPRSVGSTKIEDQNIVLYLSIDASRLKPGNYSLALKRNGGEWERYALAVN